MTRFGFGCAPPACIVDRSIRYQDQVLAQLVKLTDKVDNQAGPIATLTATIEALKQKR